ncbi:hypothetical protein DPMN_079700 [Dreissena polymorpha]|uniref:Uncharacterized protein n=1 Tax=Dreissena polymorpha TaxID=45954 RepID=A0A9D4BRE5_DREPO|nr:hypothetical protein DPMN_079700 [Dreissena polymorpha]
MNNYKSAEEGCVTNMLTTLKLNSLQVRRAYNSLVMLYKIAGGMVPALDPDEYLTSKPQRRTVKVKTNSDYTSSNILDRHITNNSRAFKIPSAQTNQYNTLFFVETLVLWNHLDDSVVRKQTVEGFKQALPDHF